MPLKQQRLGFSFVGFADPAFRALDEGPRSARRRLARFLRLPAFRDVLKLRLVIAAGDAQIDMRVRLGEALRYLR